MSLAHELAAFDRLERDAPAGGRRVASRRDSRNRRSNDAAVEVEIRERRLQGTAGRTQRQAELEPSAARSNRSSLKDGSLLRTLQYSAKYISANSFIV